jgi:hypothetical protein
MRQNREMPIIGRILSKVDKAFMPCPKGHKSPFYPCVMSFGEKAQRCLPNVYADTKEGLCLFYANLYGW